MKATLRFIFIFAWVFGSLTVFSQPAPCIQKNGETFVNCPASPSPLVSDGTNTVHLKIFDSPTTLQNPPNGRYKAFWILGDGNYRYYVGGITPELDAPSKELVYNYHRGGRYNVSTFLSEKKSNTDPPPNPYRRVDVINLPTTVANVDTFSTRLSSGKPVDIFNNEWNRPNYPTAFVVSAPKNNPVLTGIYFFYNNEQKADGSYVPTNLHDLLTPDPIKLPDYFSGAAPTTGLVSSLSSTSFPSWFLNKVRAEFQNYIFIPVSRNIPNNMPGPFSEIRFFPTLKSNWDPNWISTPDTLLPNSRYLAISVGGTPLRGLTKYISADSAETILKNISAYFGDADANGVFELSPPSDNTDTGYTPGQYIHGIDIRDVEMLLSIDPNGLQVLQICPEGQGKYKVKIRLEVCNKGYAPESNFLFSLTDHTNTFSEPIFAENKIQQQGSASSNQWSYIWKDEVLDGFPLPHETNKPHTMSDENCANVEFTATTNWAGIQSLVDGKALELCVTFAYAKEECQYNTKVEPVTEVTRLNGYKCGDSCQVTLCDIKCFLYFLVALITLLLILQIFTLWLLARKKYKK